MAIVTIDEIQIYYEISGSPDAPTLLLSHSLGADSSMWIPQTTELQKRFRVICYDTRGHGQSGVPAGLYTVEQLGRDVVQLLDSLAIQKVHFCGLSMGGAIGMWLGVHASQRVHKLVLCNTAAKLGTEQSWNTRIATVHSGGMKSVAPGIIERWFTAGFRASHQDVVQQTQQTIERTKVEGYTACCVALRDADQRESIAEIHVPTLVFAGAQDPVASPADGRYLTKKINGAKYVELNGAHLSNIEDATNFNNELEQFLIS